MKAGKSGTQRSNAMIWIMILSLLLFLSILVTLLAGGPLLDVDLWVSTRIPAIQSDNLTKIIIFLTNINGLLGSAILSSLVIFFLLYKKYYLELKFYLLALLGASALFSVIKLLVERVRPALKIINEQGFSFPSGHSTMSMAIALSLYFIFVTKISSSSGRVALLFLALLWPILISFSRVYLNVHWLSDTFAGFFLGIFWVTLLALLFPLPLKK